MRFGSRGPKWDGPNWQDCLPRDKPEKQEKQMSDKPKRATLAETVTAVRSYYGQYIHYDVETRRIYGDGEDGHSNELKDVDYTRLMVDLENDHGLLTGIGNVKRAVALIAREPKVEIT